MGTSNWQNISYNIGLIRKINPMSILDIGIGFGRWGILFREFLEVWDSGIYDCNWKRTIDGVEIYPGYIQEYHKYFYDTIYINNALNFLKSLDREYDLINFGDVIEHMDKETGEEVIGLALQKGKYVLITIPIGDHWLQDGTEANPYEAHKSIWYNRDFLKYKHNKIKCFEDFTKRSYSVVLLSLKKFRFSNRYGRFFNLKNFLKHKIGLRRLIEHYEKTKIKQ
jgi:hypothetical protein